MSPHPDDAFSAVGSRAGGATSRRAFSDDERIAVVT
jgi:hypothetical protein